MQAIADNPMLNAMRALGHAWYCAPGADANRSQADRGADVDMWQSTRLHRENICPPKSELRGSREIFWRHALKDVVWCLSFMQPGFPRVGY
jgi:hypothetical protein